MKKLVLLLLLINISHISFADIKDIQKSLEPHFGEIKASNIFKTDFKGLSEVIVENPMGLIYISDDGKYLIQGDIINIAKRQRISSSKEATALKTTLLAKEQKEKIELLASIKDEDKIIFKAKNEKHFINVFTDVDCPFCAKLHAEMEKMNNLGITVKYLASPLESLHPTAQTQMEKIWCAKDRVAAMDNYIKHRIVPNSPKCDNPVAKQLQVAQKLGVSGTPAIFLENGEQIAGYLPASSLIKRIEASKK